jgi:hypothetical protein
MCVFAATSSETLLGCTNVPDLSSGSGTIVQYGALSGTHSAFDHSTIGYNYETTSTVAYSAVAGSTTEAELRVSTIRSSDKSKIEPMQISTGQADISKDQYASTALVTAPETVRQARPSLTCLEKRTALSHNDPILHPFSLDRMTSEMERTGNQPANPKNQALNMHQAEEIYDSAILVTSETRMNNRAD